MMSADETILFACPIYWSNRIVPDFIEGHARLWQGKKIVVMATMGLFSGKAPNATAASSHCPQKAITLLGQTVMEQSEKYL